MPEIKLPKSKKRKYPEVENWTYIKTVSHNANSYRQYTASGTLSAYETYVNTIEDLNKKIQTLGSVVSSNPTLSEHIYPIINEIQTNIITLNLGKNELIKPEVESDYKKVIDDYEDLINKKRLKVSELQDFFENYPLAMLLIDRAVKELIPKHSLGGEEYPDFIAILHNDEHLLIELKKPDTNLFTSDGKYHHEFTYAQKQLLDYLSWTNEHVDYLRKPERLYPLPNIRVDNTRGLLIIGMKKNLSSKEKRDLVRLKYQYHNYAIKTYDDILEENQQYLNTIKQN